MRRAWMWAVIAVGLPGAPAPVYEVYAVRFGIIPAFPVASLVAGADRDRRLDIPVMVWVLKAPGRTVLFDAGFDRGKHVEQWKVRDFRSPAEAIAAVGLRPEQVDHVVISHMHWDHVGGAALFPRATVWIQREEYAYYTGAAWHARESHGGIDPEDVLALVRLNLEGRLRFVEGDDQEPIPGVRCFTGARHTWASQYLSVATAGGRVVLASDNVYLYENLEKAAPIAQTLDPAANLAAQGRIRSLASAPELIVPGHDPAVFERFPAAGPGAVRVR